MGNGLLQTSDVIDFLVKSSALKFGDFLLKSGRKAPYFINTGSFDDGAKITALSRFYAQKLLALQLPQVDVIFGPAYKGVPLAVATSMTLASEFGRNIGFSFNRKEAKTRGEGGEFVGYPLTAGSKVLLVEDVVTAGTTLQEVVPLLRERVGAEVIGVIILVDRMERGKDKLSAVQEAETELGIKVHPIVTILEIISYLSKENSSGLTLSAELLERIGEYRSAYGAGGA